MQTDTPLTGTFHSISGLVADKTAPCITIVIPGQPALAEAHRGDTLQQAIELAEQFLRIQHPCPENKDLINAAIRLGENLTVSDREQGYGLYISHHLQKRITFNFPVEFKVKVGKGFDLRDLLYYTATQSEYFVLSVSRKIVHLYSACRDRLTELKENGFPFAYEENYEYARPSHGNSYSHNVVKEFEKDKSAVKDIRLKAFLRQADGALEPYLKNGKTLFLAGGSKELADFIEVTKHAKHLAGTIKGNYKPHDLPQHAWESVQEHLARKEKGLVSGLHQQAGNGRLASGLEAAWKAATEGKGLLLVVEKDYETCGYIRDDKADLRLETPSRYENYDYVEDAVEQLVRLVIDQGGQVHFVSNGSLSRLNRVALQLRY